MLLRTPFLTARTDNSGSNPAPLQAANRSLDEQFAMHEASLALLERRLGALEAGEGPRSGGGAAAEGPRLTAGALAAAPASRSSALAAEVEANTPKGGDGGGGGGAAAAPAGAAADPGAPTSPGSAKGRASKARGR